MDLIASGADKLLMLFTVVPRHAVSLSTSKSSRDLMSLVLGIPSKIFPDNLMKKKATTTKVLRSEMWKIDFWVGESSKVERNPDSTSHCTYDASDVSKVSQCLYGGPQTGAYVLLGFA